MVLFEQGRQAFADAEIWLLHGQGNTLYRSGVLEEDVPRNQVLAMLQDVSPYPRWLRLLIHTSVLNSSVSIERLHIG